MKNVIKKLSAIIRDTHRKKISEKQRTKKMLITCAEQKIDFFLLFHIQYYLTRKLLKFRGPIIILSASISGERAAA
jgi:hypothetical protein